MAAAAAAAEAAILVMVMVMVMVMTLRRQCTFFDDDSPRLLHAATGVVHLVYARLCRVDDVPAILDLLRDVLAVRVEAHGACASRTRQQVVGSLM